MHPTNRFDFESGRIAAYFSHLTTALGGSTPAVSVCAAHMVPNSVDFIPALSTVAEVKMVLPKPKSVRRPEANRIRELGFRTHPLSRTWADDGSLVVKDFASNGIVDDDLILVDIGGYFSKSLDVIVEEYSGNLLGVLEGTENGAEKYERYGPRTVPVVTVARSPLKLPEDHLVGSSVVFSVEAVLREQSQILQTRTACVIGYGRVGRSVASLLRGRGISTVIHDTSPIAMAEASAQGYQVFRRLDAALAQSNLVVCATGRQALDAYGFAALKSGSVVATVTSADDELQMDALAFGYDVETISDVIDRYEEVSTNRYFWLINGGNAANFIHGAVIGPAIQLIEGEKLAAVHAIATGEVPDTAGALVELTQVQRTLVASVWNEHFLSD